MPWVSPRHCVCLSHVLLLNALLPENPKTEIRIAYIYKPSVGLGAVWHLNRLIKLIVARLDGPYISVGATTSIKDLLILILL